MSAPATSAALYPVLVADLADEGVRDFIAGVALANGTLHLPLVAAPVNAATHRLEIYTPKSVDPLVLLADPLGPPTKVGFPLRLRPWQEGRREDPKAVDDSHVRTKAPEAVPTEPAKDVAIAPKNVTKHNLSVRHEQELSGHKASMREDPQALVGRKLASGKLEIQSLIGAGGVGSVYRAWHRDLRIHVAVKVLLDEVQADIEFCRRFHAEALAASRLDHANLMRVFDFGQEPDGLLYLAMEHLDGKPLSETLVRGRGLPVPRICDVMVQVCAGLAHAHARGIVHRDIKPDNLVLVPSRDDDGNDFELVKVCDFGIAVLEKDGASSMVVGTPEYMSPEQCRGDSVLDGRSDVYACGVVLFELATGQLPFTAATPVKVLNRHMNVPPPTPRSIRPDLPEALEAIILKALEKEPEDRHASIRELRNDLRALSTDIGAPDEKRAPIMEAPALEPMRVARHEEPADDDEGDWLERSGSHDTGGAPGSNAAPVSWEGRSVTALVNELTTKPAPWLASLAATTNKEQFEASVEQLGWALPLLVDDAAYKTLFAIRSTLDVLAEDDRSAAWKRAGAQSLQQVLMEPALLAKLATIVLSEKNPSRESSELLFRAGTAAAYALYSTRLKLAAMTGVRQRFVETIRRLGPNAMPMIRAGLAKLEGRRAHAIAEDLAVDLLEAAPRLRDDAAGDLVARYLNVEATPALVRAAASALVAFYGDRAAPVLLALLVVGDDDARVSALEGLAAVRAIDERVIAKIAQIADKDAAPAVRAAAGAALRDVIGPARSVADATLVRLGLD